MEQPVWRAMEKQLRSFPIRLVEAGFQEQLARRVLSMSRRVAACGRPELLANFFGGAVWGNFRENANCGDPPG